MKTNFLFMAVLVGTIAFGSCSKGTTPEPVPQPPQDTTTIPPDNTDTLPSQSGKWIVDNSFATSDTFISAALHQADGKIILATHNTIRRLNQDGSDDNAFSAIYVSGGEVYCLALQTDGKILVGGSFSEIGGTGRQAVARLNSDGAVDNSFSSSIISGGIINAIALQTTGKIIVGGQFGYSDGIATGIDLIRLGLNGAIDLTFANQYVTGSYASAHTTILGLTVRSDNSLYVCGTDGGSFVERLTIDGDLDTGFNTDFGPTHTNYFDFTGYFTAVDLPDGRLLLGGNFDAIAIKDVTTIPNVFYYGPLVFIDNTGSLQQSIRVNVGGGFIRRIVLMEDNNFFIGGGYPACWLLNDDGSQDKSYDLSYPSGVGTDLIKESSTSILVTGRLILDDSQPQTITGIIRILKKP